MSGSVLLPGMSPPLLSGWDHSFVVVGAGGWISRATIALLSQVLGQESFRARVFVLGSEARDIVLGNGESVAVSALADWAALSPGPCLLVHNAFLTRDKVADLPLADYLARNRAISETVLAMASRLEVAGIVLPSTGAVYGPDGLLERDLARNPYGALKVADEEAFCELADRRHIPIAVPRIFGLSGEFINKPSLYALASFIESVRLGKPIEIRARHRVRRSYVYVGDLLALTFALAASETPRREIFDTGGEPHIEIGDLARLVAHVLNRPDHQIERQFDPTLPEDRYLGDTSRLTELWAEFALSPLPLVEQIERTAAFLYSAASARGM